MSADRGEAAADGRATAIEHRRRARGLRPPRRAVSSPSSACSCVSDLHLEKGSSFARRGMLLPPYDTAATLLRLQAVIDRVSTRRSSSASATAFTTARARRACPSRFATDLAALMAGRDWFWVAGNHDPRRAGRPARRDGARARRRRAGLPPRAVARRARQARSPATSIPARASCSAAARCAAAASPPTAAHDHAGLRRLYRLAQRARPRLCRPVPRATG